MRKLAKILSVAVVLVAALVMLTAPAAAQDDNTSYPVDTITVQGGGSASGSPDIANINIGVRTTDPDVGTVFETNNTTIDNVIEAMVNEGVAREDIRTVNIYLYQNENFDPASSGIAGEGNGPRIRYELNNELRVTVRDTNTVSDVISAAVEAGANNIFNLSFGFSDQSELEDTALERAMDDARARAERLAELSGVELGEIIVVNETGDASVPGPYEQAAMGIGGGGNVPVEPGQLNVNVQIDVTFRINR